MHDLMNLPGSSLDPVFFLIAVFEQYRRYIEYLSDTKDCKVTIACKTFHRFQNFRKPEKFAPV
jgi:hypothetical protein